MLSRTHAHTHTRTHAHTQPLRLTPSTSTKLHPSWSPTRLPKEVKTSGFDSRGNHGPEDSGLIFPRSSSLIALSGSPSPAIIAAAVAAAMAESDKIKPSGRCALRFIHHRVTAVRAPPCGLSTNCFAEGTKQSNCQTVLRGPRYGGNLDPRGPQIVANP